MTPDLTLCVHVYSLVGLRTLIKWLVTGPLHLLYTFHRKLMTCWYYSLITMSHCVQQSVLHWFKPQVIAQAMTLQNIWLDMLCCSVHCHIVNILICVRGLTVRSGACLQLSLCFALCTRHLPPPSSKMSMLKTGSERISGYVLVHVGLSQSCHILIWATLYGKK